LFRISGFGFRISVWLLFWGVAVAAAADTNALLDAWFSAQTTLHTWSAEFVQMRALRTLVQPLTATGRVWVAFPDRFRWELGEPAQTIALRRADELLVIYPRLKRVERYPLAGPANGPWHDAAALLEAGFPRSRGELEARFRVLAVTSTRDRFRVALQPKNAAARKLMPELGVEWCAQPFSLLATDMRFTDGSTLRNEFLRPLANPPLHPALFEFKPDADFTIVDPLRR
jgi:outer membrane lipoprotein-sorting protein